MDYLDCANTALTVRFEPLDLFPGLCLGKTTLHESGEVKIEMEMEWKWNGNGNENFGNGNADYENEKGNRSFLSGGGGGGGGGMRGRTELKGMRPDSPEKRMRRGLYHTPEKRTQRLKHAT